jgi:hypothetical protein
MLNKYLLFYLLLLIFEVVVATMLKYFQGLDNPGSQEDGTIPWYLMQDIKPTASQIAQVFLFLNFLNDFWTLPVFTYTHPSYLLTKCISYYACCHNYPQTLNPIMYVERDHLKM